MKVVGKIAIALIGLGALSFGGFMLYRELSRKKEGSVEDDEIAKEDAQVAQTNPPASNTTTSSGSTGGSGSGGSGSAIAGSKYGFIVGKPLYVKAAGGATAYSSPSFTGAAVISGSIVPQNALFGTFLGDSTGAFVKVRKGTSTVYVPYFNVRSGTGTGTETQTSQSGATAGIGWGLDGFEEGFGFNNAEARKRKKCDDGGVLIMGDCYYANWDAQGPRAQPGFQYRF